MTTCTTLLALDASTSWLSVAATDGHTTVALDEDLGPRAGARVLDAVDACLDGCGLARTAVQGIVVGIGPGAFTGVRLAVGVAQGLAYGLGVPVLGLSGLLALAEEAWTQTGAQRVLVANDARMGELYWAAYERTEGEAGGVWRARVEPSLAAPAQLRPPFDDPWIICGNATEAPGAADPPAPQRLALSHPRARYLLQLARSADVSSAFGSPAGVQPLYVRDKVALTTAERQAAAPAMRA